METYKAEIMKELYEYYDATGQREKTLALSSDEEEVANYIDAVFSLAEDGMVSVEGNSLEEFKEIERVKLEITDKGIEEYK